METWMWAVIAGVAIVVVAGVVALMVAARHRHSVEQTTNLRDGFGPEYARTVSEQGRAGAEKDLLGRQKSAELFKVRTLSAIEVARYNESWTEAQARFVDEPGAALTAADRLVVEVIAARGYPAADFEQGANAISVDHPRAVQDYRTAHEVGLNNRRNPVATDDLRAAMVQFRSVFTELLDPGVNAAAPVVA